jgi:hypothetical protein
MNASCYLLIGMHSRRILGVHMKEPSYTIAEFCDAENICRGMYYKLKRAGKGPREMAVGTHKRISHAARIDWQRDREVEAARQKSG